MFTLIRRRIILSLSALLMVLSISVFPLSSEASAKTIQEMNISEASAAMGYYYALRVCIRDAIAISDFSQESLDKYGFFGDKAVILGGQFITSDGDWDGVENCSSTKDKTAGEDSGWVRNAIATLGYSNPRDFLCHVMSGAGTVNYESCRGGQGNLSTFEFATKTKAEREAAFSATVGKKVFSNTEPLNRVEGDAIMQNILYNTFYAFCQPTDHNGGSVGSNLKQMAVKKYEAGPPATYTDKQVVVKTDRLNKTVGIIEASPEGMHRTLSCNELPGNISIFADRAKSDLKDLRTNFFENANTGTGTFHTVDDGSKSSCVVEGVGWIICPLSNFLAGITDGLFGVLTLLLETSPMGIDNPTYRAWQVMRNIANVAFVIAFIIIVFSQLSSVGIGNYGIKRMLPRLIVAAILVNVSYFICALAVDVSNILGNGLRGIFETVNSYVTDSTSTGNNLDVWGDLTGWILAGGLISGTGVAAALSISAAGGWLPALALLLPVLVTTLIAVITVVLVLAARQALIIILIAIAPLAFVAFLLPNTEDWFNRWRKLFMTMLLLFPIVSVIFGGAQLAATIIRNGTNNPLIYVLSLAVQIVPFFLVPILMKFSGGILNRFGGIVNNPNKGPFDRLRKSAQNFGDMQRNRGRSAQLERYKETGRGGAVTRWQMRRKTEQSGVENVLKRAETEYVAQQIKGDAEFRNKAAGGGRFSTASPTAQNAVWANAVSALDKMEEEEVSNVEKLIRQGKDPNEMIKIASDTLATAIGQNDVATALAAQKILRNSGNKGLDALHDTLATNVTTPSQKSSDVVRNLRSDLNSAGLKGKNNVLAAWSYSDANQTLTDVVNNPTTLNTLTDAELAGQSYSKALLAAPPGAITKAQAESLIDNQNIWKDIDENKKVFFEGVAGRPSIHR